MPKKTKVDMLNEYSEMLLEMRESFDADDYFKTLDWMLYEMDKYGVDYPSIVDMVKQWKELRP